MTQKEKNIQIGRSYQVVHLNECEPMYRKRLISMGFTPGAVFELTRLAPLGDPIEIKIKGCSLAVRRKELMTIHFEDVRL